MLHGTDRIGFLADVTRKVSSTGANVLYANSKAVKNRTIFRIKYIVEVKSRKQIQEIENGFKELDEIKSFKIKEIRKK